MVKIAAMKAQKAMKRIPAAKAVKRSPLKKIRLGIMTGKDFDPVPSGTEDRDYPKKYQFPNATRGGKYHIDVSTGLKIARKHPDLFKIVFMTGRGITAARAKKNHLNLNFWYDVGVAKLSKKDAGYQKHVQEVTQVHQDPECRQWPSWDYYDWVLNKTRYMKQCIKAGIPMIDTIIVEGTFDPASVLKKIQAKGWDQFFIKAAHYSFFGNGAINGKTADFVSDPSRLQKYAKDNANMKAFLVQPYVLKPNGKVFDEIRNFFINGEWSHSIYTDGDDDDAEWEEPAGKRKEAAKKLAIRVYQEVLKVAKWQAKPITTLLSRIDIGFVPDKSPAGYRYFLNEIECEMTTWFARYTRFNLADRMADAAVNKARELLNGLLQAGKKLPDAGNVRKVLAVLDERLGPL